MADTKISALTAATTPLAGTEVAPIVQSGTTVKAAVTSFTNGIALTPASVTLATGNVVLNAGITSDVGILKNTGRGFGVASDRWIGSDGTFVTWFYNVPTGGNHYFAVNSVNKLSVIADDVKVDIGNLVIGTSGKGIDFSATAGSGTSELLADYEEGTFTATLTTTGGSITLAAATDLCSYTKVGRQVTVTGLIIVSSVSLPTGGVSMNLPFAVGGDAESSLAGGTFVIYQDAPTYVTTLEEATFEEGASSLTINMNAASIGADDQFRFSFTYFA